MALDFPANPVDGQVFGSYTYSSLKGAWQSREESAAPAVMSPVKPVTANNGDIWVNTNEGTAFAYYDDGNSSQWIELVSSNFLDLNTKANLSGGNTFSGTQNFGTPISVSSGGTGTNTLTASGYLKGNGTSAITSQSGIPAGDITSGSLDIARGGTGTTLGAGGVEMVPSSTSVNAGSASVAADGTVTFSGVTTLGLNGIFNANYEHYTVVVTNFAASSGGSNQAIQLRANNTTVTSGYQWYGYRFVSWSNAAIAGNGSTSWYLMESFTQSNAYYTSVMHFISPFNSSEYTRYVNSSYIYAGNYGMAISNGMNSALSSHDGITLTFTAASSGRVKIYGYR
jgi:hypothetical protein